MANTFDSSLQPRILAGALDVLREEAALAAEVSKDFNGAAASVGETVTINKPTAQTAGDVTPAATPPAFVDKTYDVTSITIDKWKRSAFYLTDREAQQILAGNIVPNQVKEAARALAYQLNSDLWANYKQAYGYAGTAGTDPFATNTNPVVDARKVLNYQMCPDGNRVLLIGLTEEASALKLDDFKKMFYAGDAKAFRNGDIGNLYGCRVRRDRQRPVHTAGTITTGLITKASTVVAAGLKTAVATTAASTGACALLVGDVIAIAGHTTTYTLTATATQASAATDVTLTFEPGLEVALAGSEAITVKASHGVNLAFDPAGFGLVMRTLKDSIEGAPTLGQHMVMTDPVTGMPLKLSYYPGYHANQWELSILYGSKIIDLRRVVRLAGATS